VAAHLAGGPTGPPDKCLAARRPSPPLVIKNCHAALRRRIKVAHSNCSHLEALYKSTTFTFSEPYLRLRSHERLSTWRKWHSLVIDCVSAELKRSPASRRKPESKHALSNAAVTTTIPLRFDGRSTKSQWRNTPVLSRWHVSRSHADLFIYLDRSAYAVITKTNVVWRS